MQELCIPDAPAPDALQMPLVTLTRDGTTVAQYVGPLAL